MSIQSKDDEISDLQSLKTTFRGPVEGRLDCLSFSAIEKSLLPLLPIENQLKGKF